MANPIMICLDTNYLIRALIPGTTEAVAVERWLEADESLCIPTVAWYEFLCGSTDEEEQLALALLDGGILPFGEIEAQSAAAGFRSLNKPRRLRVDAMIAALFGCALALVETGRRLANKESLSRFGEVLLAGGMAFFYFCTFAALAGLTCLVATLWATQMLVWRFGWKPTAVLWTILGFAFVSAGLWQRLHILRVCGFGLLIVFFCKHFAMDIWDFTTFMRVASFIVLGADPARPVLQQILGGHRCLAG